jgi:putative ABC transport system permease protein
MTVRWRRWRLVLRALWWRRGLTAAVLAVAVVTTTAAALGPLYARAAGESILQDHLNQAGSSAGVHMYSDLDIGRASTLARTAAAVPRPGSIPGYDRQIQGLYTPKSYSALAKGSQVGVVATLVWRDGACAHLVVVAGRCPSAPNEAMASQRTVGSQYYGFRLGVSVSLGAPLNVFNQPMPDPSAVRIVGVYRAKDTADPFWFGQELFAAAIGGNDRPDAIDSLFVARGEFLSFGAGTTVEADYDYPLTTSAVRLDSAAREQAAVAGLLARSKDDTAIAASSALPTVLRSAARERHLAEVSTLLVTVQLALLAWLVMFQIVSDAIDARGNEIAMAKLRGLSAWSTIRFGLAEPVVLLAAAVPIGLLLAFAATHVFAGAVLVPGVPVVLPLAAFGTALLAFAGGLIAAGLAGYRTLTRSVLDQWRRTDRAPGGHRAALVLDAVVAAAAVAGFVALRVQHSPTAGGGAGNNDVTTGRAVSLLAPGLLVAAVGVLGVRLLPLLCRGLARRTRAARGLAVFLAARQVARRPVGLRLAALLAVAVGLATFAVSGESVALANRTARAQTELGAARVASVQLDAGVDPVAATAKADPDGHWAMAAARWLPDGGDSVVGTVLGVDGSRLAKVGYASAGGPSLSDLARTIQAAPVAPIVITAPRVRVHVRAAGLVGDKRPYLELNLRTAQRPFYAVDSTSISDGDRTYPVPVSCATGCTLVGLTWNRSIDAQDTQSGTITLTGIDVARDNSWTPLDIGLHAPGSWRAAVATGQATDRLQVSTTGVTDRFSNRNGGYGGIVYASSPSPMPAIATRKSIAVPPPPAAGTPTTTVPTITDSTYTPAYFRIVRYAPVLPAVLDNGVVIDVRYLLSELPGFVTEAQWQVWLGPDAPADAATRLGAAGMHLESVHSERARLSQLGRQGPALALLLLVVCAIVGTVLAVGGTAISISASSRRRTYEIAALRAVGVPRRSLFGAGAVEQLLLLGAAAVLGIPAGWVAARLAMPEIPEFADRTPIALDYVPAVIPTALFAVAFVVLLTVTSLLAARALIRTAAPSRLREAEG